jgi:hypothetical protein
MMMMPRHAAALALVAWFLMMPMIMNKESESDSPPDSISAKPSPSDCGQQHYITFRGHVDPKAPLSRWSIANFSDSMRSCEALLDKFKARSYGNRGADADQKRIQMDERLRANAKCVAGDDLRLNGNEEVREFQLMTPNERRLLIRDIGRSESEQKPATPNGK